jgi:hypothetical protein
MDLFIIIGFLFAWGVVGLKYYMEHWPNAKDIWTPKQISFVVFLYFFLWPAMIWLISKSDHLYARGDYGVHKEKQSSGFGKPSRCSDVCGVQEGEAFTALQDQHD